MRAKPVLSRAHAWEGAAEVGGQDAAAQGLAHGPEVGAVGVVVVAAGVASSVLVPVECLLLLLCEFCSLFSFLSLFFFFFLRQLPSFFLWREWPKRAEEKRERSERRDNWCTETSGDREEFLVQVKDSQHKKSNPSKKALKGEHSELFEGTPRSSFYFKQFCPQPFRP